VADALPLSGVRLQVGGSATGATLIAGELLAGLGARLEPGRRGGRGLATVRAGGGRARELPCDELKRELDGFPTGTLRYATALCLTTATICALLRPGEYAVDPIAVAAQLLLPHFLAASHRAPAPPAPPDPVPVGDGFVWCDLPSEEDRALFAALREGEESQPRAPRELAGAAQACGLAVLDFRTESPRELPLASFHMPARGTRDGRASLVLERSAGREAPPLEGVRICDMTTMWSGPLATWLLASLGADVCKVEPACRLDGTRGIAARPNGDAAGFDASEPTAPGEPHRAHRAAAFRALNRNKSRRDLDLRDLEQRAAFRKELSGAQLLISNFSPRVSRNLGIGAQDLAAARERPLTCLTMPAFPDGAPERQWRAYGSGVHAVSGLGVTSDGRPWTAPAPYCDMLSGFAASAVATASVFAMSIDGRVWEAETPMLNVAAKLARVSRPRSDPPRADTDLGERFLAAHGERAGVLVDSPHGSHLHPRSPFHGPGLPLADVPAPELDS
jgi:CoA-transferase family III